MLYFQNFFGKKTDYYINHLRKDRKVFKMLTFSKKTNILMGLGFFFRDLALFFNDLA